MSASTLDATMRGKRVLENLTGREFGRLIVIERADSIIQPSGQRKTMWVCICQCGARKSVRSESLLKGSTRSCGCFQVEHAKENGAKSAKHGHGVPGNQSRTYKSWIAMRQRCLNPQYKKWSIHGGRGIKVADRWLGEHGFENFLSDMGERPERMTVERVDNSGNYEPGNCVWANRYKQARNKRNTVLSLEIAREARALRRIGMPPTRIAESFGLTLGNLSGVFYSGHWPEPEDEKP